uniref:Uncharacterized protein n=1 Tax=Glossina pallidipes TaxID=7398 RepID=A0A1A9ZRV4_GLOPL
MKRKGENQLNTTRVKTNPRDRMNNNRVCTHCYNSYRKEQQLYKHSKYQLRTDGDCKPRAVGFVDTNEVVADADDIVVAATAKGVLAVSNDNSLSLCNEALMRSGLRGGGSGGSEAAIVGPPCAETTATNKLSEVLLLNVRSNHEISGALLDRCYQVVSDTTHATGFLRRKFLNAFAERLMMTLVSLARKTTSPIKMTDRLLCVLCWRCNCFTSYTGAGYTLESLCQLPLVTVIKTTADLEG